jgi:ElaA protein
MLSWHWFEFGNLSLEQLYDIIALRERTFAHEQHCTATDFDGLDKQAMHLLGMQNNEIIAYARILPPGVYAKDTVSFGRLIITQQHRGKGLGKQMMQEVINYITAHYPNAPIKFSAQTYLQSFYEKFNFRAVGDVYDEGGIPHIRMQKMLNRL